MEGSDRSPEGEARLEQLLERARRVLPQDWPYGSVWAVHHHHGDAQGVYPHFAERADGARFRDIAGREYLDWFLGGGVLTLGHRHPAVQQAIAEQLERGVHLSLPSGLEVDVAERLCAIFPGAEQVAFGKNGTDVTSAAVRLARALTGREQVLISGYHGWQDWSMAARAGCAGIPATLRPLVHEFGCNDLEGARALLERQRGAVAAIVVEPVRHAALRPELLPGLRALADEHGALLIFDEIVTGFRVARAGAQQLAGVRPDLTCLAKSLANGLPLSALAGPRRFMQHLPPTWFGLTYQREALSLAAARATLDVHRDHDVAGHLAALGERLRAGFAALAAAAGLDWSLDGHPAMLHLRLKEGGRLQTAGAEALFVECCQREGIYLQLHRLLPSFAHTVADVEQTLAVMARAMEEVKRAMRQGLEGRLDSPIWSEHQVPPSDPPPATAERRSDVVACPFRGVPADLRAGGIAPFHAAADSPAATPATPANQANQACRVSVDAGRLLVQIERRDAQASVRAGVELVHPVPADVTVRARYRILQPPTGNALLSIVLAGSGTVDGAWLDVRHTTSPGQPAASSASIAGQYLRRPCPYGMREGTLELTHRRGVTTAAHETEERVTVGELAAPSQPMRLRFQVELTGASGPVAVELADLGILALPGAD